MIYGLNKKVGNISYYDSQGRDSFTKPYSEVTARVIDEEVSKIIESQYQRALQILTDNKEKLTELAEKLLDQEVIFKEDLEQIFGKRQWEKEEEVPLVEKPVSSLLETESAVEETTSETPVVEEKENVDTTPENDDSNA